MSEMSALLFGIGNEAFEEPLPVSTGYVPVEVDHTELVNADDAMRASDAEINDQMDKVRKLSDAVTYARDVRETITEVEARELQSRVIAVLGDDAGPRLMGSMESYNGPLAGQLLDAGLEGIGSMLRTALAALIKLIRTGFRIMMQFITSAKLVLGRQLKALGELRRATSDKLEGWEEFQITWGNNSGLTVKKGPGTASGISPITPITPIAPITPISPIGGGQKQLSAAYARLLTKTEGNVLKAPTNMSGELRDTARIMKMAVIPAVDGVNRHFGAVLDMLEDADRMDMGQRYNALNQLTYDKFLPMNMLLVGRESNKFGTVLSTTPVLGDYELRANINPLNLVNGFAGKTGDQQGALRNLGLVSFNFTRTEKASATGTPELTSLSRQEALLSIACVEDLLKTVIDYGLDATAARLGGEADKVVTRVLPRLTDGSDDTFTSQMTMAIGTLSRLTNMLPQSVVSYTNNLTNAVKQYVEISAQL